MTARAQKAAVFTALAVAALPCASHAQGSPAPVPGAHVPAAQVPAAQVPAAQAAQIALMEALDRVCRPAAERQQAPDAFAQAAGYAPTPLPPHLPLTNDPSVRAWRAPSPVGRLYVIAGVLPQVATPSACMVALYDVATPGLAPAVQKYLDRVRPGFTPNTGQNGASRSLSLTRFDHPAGKTVHTVVVADFLQPEPGGPTEIVSAFTVDFSWRKGR